MAEAEGLYRRVLALRADQADALYLLAGLRLNAGPSGLAEAISLLRRAVAAQPGFARAQALLGEALAAAGQAQAGMAALQAALAADPGFAEARFALGKLLFGQRRYAAAAACFREVAAARPGDVPALNNLAVAAQHLGDAEGAVAAYRRALALEGGSADLHSNLGCALLALNGWEEAAACHRRALALRPGDPAILANLAASLAPSAPEEAIARYREAIAAAPENADAHYALSLVLLQEGRYREGWAEMEWWRRTANGIAARRHEGLPAWDGAAGAAPVLVYAQQGFGDTLQFARFIRQAAARRPVLLEAPRALHRLLAGLGVELVLPGAPGVRAGCACSLLSLPHLLGVGLGDLPGDVAYLRADPSAVAAWRARLASLGGLKVGLCWAGSPDLGGRDSPLRTDRHRSLPLAALAPLAGVAGVHFVSLQKGGAAGQSPPAGMVLHDHTAELHDFGDTAALVSALDLVITVDTAVAHLAGALGRPVWLLNRWDSDWRWLRGRDDSPWYPSLRQFRQRAPGDWAAPLAEMRAALAADPATLYGAARAASAAGERGRAMALYRHAATLAPAMAEAWNNLGNLLAAEGRGAEALGAYEAALAARPEYAEALANQGMALRGLGRLGEAEAALRRAIVLAPALPHAHNALGTALSAQGRLEEALAAQREAVRLAPGEAVFQTNQGLVLARLRRARDAIGCHRRAVALAPESGDAHLALAEALLLDGQLRDGFAEYEWRGRARGGSERGFRQRLWTRDAPAGRTVLLHAEQGLGDSLQFCRFIPLVARRARVIVEAPRALHRLLARMPGVSRLLEPGEALPAFDLHCPLPGLAHACGTRLATIPAEVPYLSAEPAEVAAWGARLAGLGGRRIGLCWAGNRALADSQGGDTDARRSLPAGALAPLSGLAGVSFVSLQKSAAAAPGLALHDITGELHDLAATAAVIANLDLVISVDTAIAHLAGAMGRPVWLLNRFDGEWRWLLSREDSPWYPSLRQFRQPTYGDWESVIEKVRKEAALF